MSTTIEQGTGQAHPQQTPLLPPRPTGTTETAEATVRELIIELAEVEYEMRHASPQAPDLAALIEREGMIVAALHSQRLEVTSWGDSRS